MFISLIVMIEVELDVEIIKFIEMYTERIRFIIWNILPP